MKQHTKAALTKFFKEQGFNVYSEKEYTEIEKWTDGGVDMIITLQPFSAEEFNRYVTDFNIDELIDLYRESDQYKANFSIRESLNDFTNFHNHLKDINLKLQQ